MSKNNIVIVWIVLLGALFYFCTFGIEKGVALSPSSQLRDVSGGVPTNEEEQERLQREEFEAIMRERPLQEVLEWIRRNPERLDSFLVFLVSRLENRNDQDAAVTILSFISGAHPSIRQRALELLGSLRERTSDIRVTWAVDALINVMSRNTPTESPRSDVQIAIDIVTQGPVARLGFDEAVDTLRRAIREGDEYLEKWTIKRIRVLLSQESSSGKGETERQKLIQLSKKADESEEVRRRWVSLLGMIHLDEKDLDFLQHLALTSKGPSIRIDAVGSLVSSRLVQDDVRAVKRLEEILEQANRAFNDPKYSDTEREDWSKLLEYVKSGLETIQLVQGSEIERAPSGSGGTLSRRPLFQPLGDAMDAIGNGHGPHNGADDPRQPILDELDKLNQKTSIMDDEIEQVLERVMESRAVMRRVEKELLGELDHLAQVMGTSQTKLTELIGEFQGSIERVAQLSTDFAPNMNERITRLQTEVSQDAISLEPLISWMSQTKQDLEPMMREYEQASGRSSEKESSDRFMELYVRIRETSDMEPVCATLFGLRGHLGGVYSFIAETVNFIRTHEPRLAPEIRPSPVEPRPPSPKPTEILQNVLNELGYRPNKLDLERVVKTLPQLLPTAESLREIIQTYPTDRKIHWLLLLSIHYHQKASGIDSESQAKSLMKERINRINHLLMAIHYPHLPEATHLYEFVLYILEESRYHRSLQEKETSYKMAKRIVREVLRNNKVPKDIVWRDHLRIGDRYQRQFVLTPMVFHWIQSILHRSMAANLVALEDHYKLERELITEAALSRIFETAEAESKEAFRDILIAGITSMDVMDLLVSRGSRGFFEIQKLVSGIDKVWRTFSLYRNHVMNFSSIEFNSPTLVLYHSLEDFNKLISPLSPAGAEVLAQSFGLTRLLESFLASQRDSLALGPFRSLSELIAQFQAVRDKHIRLGRLDLLAYQEIQLVQKLDRLVDQALSEVALEQDREALRVMRGEIVSFFGNPSIKIHQIAWHTNELNHDISHLFDRLLSALGKSPHERNSILGTIPQSIFPEFSKIMNDLKWFRIDLTTAGRRLKKAAGKYRDLLEREVGPSWTERKGIGLEVIGKDLLDLIERLEDVKGTREESTNVNLQQELEQLINSYKNANILQGVDMELQPEPAMIVGEISPSAFRRVMRNLIDNAIDAMGGKGKISIRCNHDHLKRKVFIEIQDTGTGIEPENLGKIFDPQFTTKSGGTGTGLAIVKDVVEFYNGTIEVKSRPISQYPQGHGTAFTVGFPSIEQITVDDMKLELCPPHVLHAL